MIADDFPERGDNFETVGLHAEVTGTGGRIVAELLRARTAVSTQQLHGMLGVPRREIVRMARALAAVGILRETQGGGSWALGALVENEIERREKVAEERL